MTMAAARAAWMVDETVWSWAGERVVVMVGETGMMKAVAMAAISVVEKGAKLAAWMVKSVERWVECLAEPWAECLAERWVECSVERLVVWMVVEWAATLVRDIG